MKEFVIVTEFETKPIISITFSNDDLMYNSSVNRLTVSNNYLRDQIFNELEKCNITVAKIDSKVIHLCDANIIVEVIQEDKILPIYKLVIYKLTNKKKLTLK